MSRQPVTVVWPDKFKEEARELKDKYPSTFNDLQPLDKALRAGNTPGEQIQGIGKPTYKERVGIKSANRGSQGGFRVVYYIRMLNCIYMLTIYAKSEREDISRGELKERIRKLEDSRKGKEGC